MALTAIVNLQTASASGLNGTFTNIQEFIGNSGATLIGPDSGVIFNMTGAGAGNVAGGFSFTASPTCRVGRAVIP